MLDKFIKAGQRIDMKSLRRVRSSDGETQEKVYTTRIYDIVSEDTIELVMPMEQTKLILLPIDGEYEVFFYTENGLYECNVRIIDRYKSNNVYILLVELQTNLRKYQRRDFYRYSCALDLESRNLTPEEIDAFKNSQAYTAPRGIPASKSTIVDISGGGLRFISQASFEVEHNIMCKYDLFIHGGVKGYEIICEVLGKRSLDNKPGFFEYRVRFLNLNNDEREEIIQYIFEEERKNRRKERGLR